MLCPGAAAIAAVDYKIVTASERGTYIKIGRDLAEFVAPSADIKLDAVPSAGSAENVRRLLAAGTHSGSVPISSFIQPAY